MTIPKAISIDVRGQQLAGLSWGNPGHAPLIALHGWLDNAESFSYLAPLIKQRQVIAVDLMGHGLSDHRPQCATYYFTEYVLDIAHAIKSITDQPVDVLGHSLGAGIACALAVALPNQINTLVLLDAIGPWPGDDEGAGTRLQKAAVHSLGRTRDHLSYASLEELEARRKNATPSLSDESIARLVKRNAEQHDGRWRWRTDRRLQNTSPIMFNEQAAIHMLKKISCPALHIGAEQGLFVNTPFHQARLDAVSNLTHSILPGAHHFHMDAAVADIAMQVNAFLNR